MRKWLKVSLGDAMLATALLSELKERLSGLYQDAGSPETMQAVYSHESGSLHCKVVVYLTEEFQALAKLENARSCSLPSASDFGYLAGYRSDA